MGKEKRDAIAIYFSKQEYEKLQTATQYTTLSDTNLIRILLRKKLNLANSNKIITFCFSLENPVEKENSKTKVVRLNEDDYLQLRKICNCVYLTASNLVKYWIMPDIEEIIKSEGWEVEN